MEFTKGVIGCGGGSGINSIPPQRQQTVLESVIERLSGIKARAQRIEHKTAGIGNTIVGFQGETPSPAKAQPVASSICDHLSEIEDDLSRIEANLERIS